MTTALAVIVLISVLTVVIWDGVCLIIGHRDDTVSQILHDWSTHSPLAILLVGIFIGHVFARLR